MGDPMGDAVDAAVGHAMSGSGGEGPSSPASSDSGGAPPKPDTDAAKPAAKPAAASGSEAAPAGSDKPGAAPTKQATSEAGNKIDQPGAPPQGEWPTILSNARSKERASVVEEYGLADYPASDVREHLTLLNHNPVELFYRLGQNLQRAGLIPAPNAGGNAGGSARSAERPKGSLQTEDGKTVYSEADVAAVLDWHESQILSKLEQRFGPLEEVAGEVQEQGIRSRAIDFARRTLDEAKSWDRFEELSPKIKELMRSNKKLTLLEAYNSVYQGEAKGREATLREKVRQETIDELNQTPDPNTARPGRAAASRKSEPRRKSLDQDIDAAIAHATRVHS